MKTKSLVIALALSALPTLGLAAGCSSKEKQAMSCAAGTAYDHATATCLPVSS